VAGTTMTMITTTAVAAEVSPEDSCKRRRVAIMVGLNTSAPPHTVSKQSTSRKDIS
jgi:hypothetical protein